MTTGFPYARAGQTIGLLGGSFDPAHRGHTHITQQALKRFGLDRVWWLVSPGNPLKTEGPASLERRMAAARGIMQHPRVVVSDIEARLGTRHTAGTLRALRRRYPGVRFVWLMGADNLVQFHRWEQWREILRIVPVGVFARPGQRTGARRSKTATQYRRARLKERDSSCLAHCKPPCWCFVNVPMIKMSSSDIRARGEWQR